MPSTYEKREATACWFGGPSERNDDLPVEPHEGLYLYRPESKRVALADMAAVGCAIGNRRPTRVGDITVRGAGQNLPRPSETLVVATGERRRLASATAGRNGRVGNLMTPRREVRKCVEPPKKKEMSERGKGVR